MSATDDYLVHNARYVESFAGPLPTPPSRATAVVACMDSRLNVYAALGLADGEAHVIRNAGGVVTDDVIRSLAISQRLLGTREVIVIHHTGCGLLTITDEQFARTLQADTGHTPQWRAHAFTDLEDDVRVSLRLIRESPFLPATDAVRGFVFDVTTGGLAEVR